MRQFLLVLSMLILSACAKPGDDPQNIVTEPTIDYSDDEREIIPPVAEIPVESPPATPPVVTPPVVTPPANLTCARNNLNVFCTGGNLGASTVQLDINGQFNGNQPQVVTTVLSVQNNVNANLHAVCTQPNGPGCKQNSVCVNTTNQVAGGGPAHLFTWCGNAVSNTRFLIQQ